MNAIWHDKEHSEHSPLHDLMVIRMEEEIGIATASTKLYPIVKQETHNFGGWYWAGESGKYYNSMKTFPAGIADVLDPEVLIFTLGYLTKKQMKDYDTLHEILYKADDAVLVDCDEWLPREWGFFICIRNIGNFPGIGSGATLFSNEKLFGIASFAMFKQNTGILVFTDVRKYEELIEKTCGDEEFT
ncbi:hypothetical protein PYW08_011959 [Mythimna loreyi]|uniref:Uncharacterized protein n=1 Tax=Mythimna loreyi TaxID=667449 RepID=A0ACC2QR27_9NEOP|nr:hypothetical protein PYW08_011959 [Mythimna loreyi]